MTSRILALAASAVATLAVLGLAHGPAHADELQSVYAQVLNDPTNSALNIRYAELAEARQEYRKALAAYERVLVNDPGNLAARDALQRVRRIIQPPLTQKTVEVGTTWESNPLHDPDLTAGDVFGYGRFSVKDERRAGSHRWRTNFSAYGEAHADNGELDYGTVSADIGPLVDLPGTLLSFRPAVGGSTAFFDDRFYYWDVNASGLVEGYLNGAYQWARARVGYRQFDPASSSDDGLYADLAGKLSYAGVLHERDVASVAPWFRWSNFSVDPDFAFTDYAPGRYVEAGAVFQYASVLSDSLTAAVNLRVSARTYEDMGTGSRHDTMVSPGAALIVTNVFGAQTDLRFDYHYQWNTSNDPLHTWDSHVVTAAFVVRR
jgi:hypothetical protein